MNWDSMFENINWDIVVSNVSVCLFILLVIVAAVWIKNSPIWRASFVKIYEKRKIAILICSIYLFIALADSVIWMGPKKETKDSVATETAVSVIDVIFQGKREKTYSEPLSSVSFGKGEELDNPGQHLLGTDLIGRDVFYMTLKAVRPALILGGVTTLVVIPFALLVGVIAGYFRGWVDDIIIFIIQVLSSIPSLLLLIAIIMALGRGTLQVCLAMAITSWVGFCRVTRGETLKLREMDYVEAARALGVHPFKILWRHITPNLGHLIIINFTLFFCGQILAETVLAYLGIGVGGSWGMMIDQARNELSRDPLVWWNLISAGTALLTLILCVNLIGDTARDIFDPRTHVE